MDAQQLLFLVDLQLLYKGSLLNDILCDNFTMTLPKKVVKMTFSNAFSKILTFLIKRSTTNVFPIISLNFNHKIFLLKITVLNR